MEQERVLFSERDGTLIAMLSCEIDHHTTRCVRERIDRQIFLSKPELLIIDFSGVRFMDSSGIALIIGRVETMEAVGGRVQLTGMSLTLQKLIRLSGLDRLRNLSLSFNS